MFHRHRRQLLNIATGAGYFLMFVGIVGDGRLSLADLRSAGFGLVILGLMQSATAIWEHGHQRGYDRGYTDGRRVSKPVVLINDFRATASRTH